MASQPGLALFFSHVLGEQLRISLGEIDEDEPIDNGGELLIDIEA